MSGGAESRGAGRAWALPLALFLAFQGLYWLTASGRVDRMADEFEVYLMTESLVDRGRLSVPQLPEAAFFGRRGLDGEAYTPYGPGSAFLALPHHLAGRALAALVGVPRADRASWTELVAATTSLSNTTWAALCVLATFFALRALDASPRRAALGAALLGGATALWPYATLFYSEPQSAALLAAAVALHLRGRAALASLAALALGLVKLSNAVAFPALCLLALGDPREWRHTAGWPARLRAVLPFFLAGLLATGVHLGLNAARFGDPFAFAYDWSGVLRPGEAPRRFLLADLPRGLLGLLLAPGKSVFFFAPPLLLALARAPAFLRARPQLAAGWLALVLGPLLFFGAFAYWEGGYCFGPRHLVPFLPAALLPLAVGPPPRRAPLFACAALGALVSLLGASVSYMEDQAPPAGEHLAAWESPYYAWHDPSDRSVPAGRPLNRYRWSYFPQLSYPRLLWRHLSAGAPGSGRTGLEFLPANLARARRLRGAAGIPAWLPWVLWAAGGFPLGCAFWLRGEARRALEGDA